jgi:glycosyltransferase involved in cell wall biosynthesis
LTRFFVKRAILKAISSLTCKPDVIYCLFLGSAVPVLDYAHRNNIPVIVASGESSYDSWKAYPIDIQEKGRKQIRHIVCVSESNKIKLMGLGFEKSKLTVVPNTVDYNLFRPVDKAECKRKLGFGEHDFVVGFVGHFIERKGPNRVIQAIEKLKDSSVKLVCVGRGGVLQHNDFTLELAPVANNKLPEIFSAFDVFVLPTLHEGHCNVIEEAKACGVPVISSKGTSVEFQVQEGQGLLIDPSDVDDIMNAISQLKSDKSLLRSFSNNLVEGEKSYDIKRRSEIIHDILERSLL